MKKLLVIIGVLLGSLFARSQPLEDLIGDVQAHKTSITGLRALFSKHPSYIDETDYTRGYNEALLGQRMEKADFHYTLADSITRHMYVQVICKNDQVGYIKIEGMRYDSSKNQENWQVAYTYVDTPYTNRVLAAYNQKHQTNFTWTDLYEDSCKGFTMGTWNSDHTDSAFDAEGNFRREITISRPMKLEFYPLIKKRDHNAIIKNCLSFNPYRKAYGAVCLYAMQQLGEPLSKTEKHLLKQCRRFREKIMYASGDYYAPAKISSLLGSNKHMRAQCRSLLLPNKPALWEF
jgi:hypothetical protein